MSERTVRITTGLKLLRQSNDNNLTLLQVTNSVRNVYDIHSETKHYQLCCRSSTSHGASKNRALDISS